MDTLKELRSDDTWNHTFKYITDVAAIHNIEEERQHSKRKRRSAIQEDYVTDSTLGHREPLNTSQSLKRDIYYPVMDHMLSEMERRFSETNLGVMKGVQACNPTSSTFLEVSILKEMASLYSLSDDLLSTECHLAKRTLAGKNIESVTDVYSFLISLQTAFPTLTKLLRIALTLAVSTTQCEISFSALKRIKTYLRTNMSEQRLTDISLLSIERELSNTISFTDVIERF